METIEYRWNWDEGELASWRARWPAGPWDNEPDKIQFSDPATGLACLIRRNAHLGFLCGYVGVPPGHPLYGQDYDRFDWIEGVTEINYAEACETDGDEAMSICHLPGPGEPEPLWWFGFDNGHTGQLAPGLQAVHTQVLNDMRADHPEWTLPDDVYYSVERVKIQCAMLAQRLAMEPADA